VRRGGASSARCGTVRRTARVSPLWGRTQTASPAGPGIGTWFRVELSRAEVFTQILCSVRALLVPCSWPAAIASWLHPAACKPGALLALPPAGNAAVHAVLLPPPPLLVVRQGDALALKERTTRTGRPLRHDSLSALFMLSKSWSNDWTCTQAAGRAGAAPVSRAEAAPGPGMTSPASRESCSSPRRRRRRHGRQRGSRAAGGAPCWCACCR
jgi:hypothetical protein